MFLDSELSRPAHVAAYLGQVEEDVTNINCDMKLAREGGEEDRLASLIIKKELAEREASFVCLWRSISDLWLWVMAFLCVALKFGCLSALDADRKEEALGSLP